MRKLFTILIVVLSTQFSFNLSAECIEGNCVNGQGTYTWSGGAQYIGEFKDGKGHGQGTNNFANGDQYIGEYKDGKYHGLGTYTYASGSQYSGEFKDDVFHGQGTETYSNGTSKTGIWRNGELILRQPYGETKNYSDV